MLRDAIQDLIQDENFHVSLSLFLSKVFFFPPEKCVSVCLCIRQLEAISYTCISVSFGLFSSDKSG